MFGATMWVVLFFAAVVGATSLPSPETCDKPIQQCPQNEHYDTCPKQCPSEGCDRMWSKIKCDPEEPCGAPTCRCNEAFYRKDGICVTAAECMQSDVPATEEPTTEAPQCSANETAVTCKQLCPPQSCNISFTEFLCDKIQPCISGCNCKENYLRNDDGICILNEECPTPHQTEPVTSTSTPELNCGYNELLVDCKRTCPPQVCEALYLDYLCAAVKPFSCKPGCMCLDNYLRNSSGICVPIEECPPPPWFMPLCGANETYVPCKQQCPPESCDISYTTYMCTEESQKCEPGCNCKENYLRNSDGICILNDECPPPPFNQVPPPIDNGETTTTTPAPTEICKENEVYVKCKVQCPTDYCAVNDLRVFPICDPAYPCPSGCICKVGFKRRSREDPTCIPAETCPPVNCTRINEEWNSCPSACLGEYCADASSPPTVCNTLIKNCQPRCVCQKGYFRNESDICIPVADCPITTTQLPSTTEPTTNITTPGQSECGANETIVPCTFKCPHNYCPENDERTTYACKPGPNCPSGCGCKPGYRYKSSDEQICILAQDCPPQMCTRPNEIWNGCPSSCLNENCQDVNNLPSICYELDDCQPKCVCKDGYYRNESDICVPKPECFQCKPNEIFAECKVDCPPSFCPTSDSRAIIACAVAYPCPSGCVCDLNYLRKSYDDPTCILASDCPPVNCTRPNEEWDSCPSGCLAEYCGDVDNPPSVCNELVKNCQPKCVCKKGFYRNESDICISKEECKQCKANERYVRCKADCPTDYCPTSDSRGIIACDPPFPCPGGCICELNYKLKSYDEPICIPTTECPPVNCTRPNEEWNNCTSSCLSEDCAYINNPAVCNEFVQNCVPKCVCKEGFFRNESEICVPKAECQQCNRPNERYVQCKAGCPTDYCPMSDSRAIIACSLPYPCPAGCVCEPNYKRKNYYDDTCISASECPPVNCSRPHEVWSPCTSACLVETCDSSRRPPVECKFRQQTCEPRCICEDGYRRDDNDVCIPEGDCPPEQVDQNTTPPSQTTTTVKPPSNNPIACGPNSSPVDCVHKCHEYYCPNDDSRGIAPCAPPPPPPLCKPGCMCNLNYRQASFNNDTCILAATCPVIECKRPNEEWSRCPLPCLREFCTDIYNQPTTCNYLVENCQPQCVCKKNHFRNDQGICIPIDQCPGYKKP